MTTRPSVEIRTRRRAALRPLFAVLEAQGRTRVWLARQVGIGRKAMYAYELGENRIPPGFVERACALLGCSPNIVDFGDTPDVFVQQRDTRTKGDQHDSQKRNTSSSHHSISVTRPGVSGSRNRRANVPQSASPTINTPARRRGRVNRGDAHNGASAPAN